MDANSSSSNFHFLIDDKFSSEFIAEASQISDNNIFICTSPEPHRFLTNNEVATVHFDTSELDLLCRSIKEKDKVFVHFYVPRIHQVLNKIHDETRVYCFFWGSEFLESPCYSKKNNPLDSYNLEPMTYRLYKKLSSEQLRKSIKSDIKKSIKFKSAKVTVGQLLHSSKRLNTKKTYDELIKLRQIFLKRIDGLFYWNKFDILTINETYQVNVKQLYFSYAIGSEEIMPIPPPCHNDKTIIWLGNSATATNNHIDILHHLKSMDISNIEIICPLNYGDKDYALHVVKEGSKLFGKNFKPILDFMPREKYYALMDQVDIAIMGHNRGQAGGNILAFLKKGKKVYLKSKSTIFQFYSSKNLKIFSVESLWETPLPQLKKPLSSEYQDQNFRLIQEVIENDNKRLEALNNILLA